MQKSCGIRQKKPLLTEPAKEEKKKEEQKEASDILGEKIQDKAKDLAKDKAKKALGLDGDKEEGVEELADIIVPKVEETIEKVKARGGSTVAAGTRAQNVSTVVSSNAGVSPVNVGNPTQAVAANTAPTPPPVPNPAAQSQQVIRAAAGHGTPPPSAAAAAVPPSRTGGIIEELMDAGAGLAKSVTKGFKESKNIRAAGLAALASAVGYGAGKVKNRPEDAKAEFIREQQLRRSLMSDG